MTTYYRGREVLITDRYFARLYPDRVQFHIDELQDAHIVRGDLHPSRMLTGHAAGITIILVAASWPFLSTPAAVFAALVAIAAPAVAAAVSWRLAPRAYELRARYRMFDVSLFATTDVTTFGQVQRGLMRALENQEFRWETVERR